MLVPRIAWLLVLGRAAHNHTSRDHTRHGVVGIISRDADLDLRDGQRRTWVCANLSSAPRVVVRFLLDRPSNATLEEAATRRDVLFLHAQFSGRGVRFGEKMYLWLMLSRKLFPDAAWVAKVDSDVYICAARMWPFVWHHWTPRVYLGWAHPSLRDAKHPKTASKEARMDEMFVLIGAGLVKRITDRNYCGNETSCDSSVDLFDTNFGGTSLGIWLSAYNDLDVVVINNLVIHMGSRIPKMKHAYPDYLKENICDTQLLFHKATDHQMDVIDRREVDAGWQHPTPLKMTHRRWRS